MANPTAVYLEVGAKKAFASAAAWPGWCRAGKDEEAAIRALEEYAGRYREVAERADVRFPKSAADAFEVVERITGNATTDFGAPGMVAEGDRERLTKAGATREAALLAGAWEVFDRIAATTPEQLRKGPRGGGRDRDKMINHVLGAETAYARSLGVKHKVPDLADSAAIKALREDILAALSVPSDGSTLTPKGWPPRYFSRRAAWHVLDHAWEMQDRTEP
jgi:hypothetical protein